MNSTTETLRPTSAARSLSFVSMFVAFGLSLVLLSCDGSETEAVSNSTASTETETSTKSVAEKEVTRPEPKPKPAATTNAPIAMRTAGASDAEAPDGQVAVKPNAVVRALAFEPEDIDLGRVKDDSPAVGKTTFTNRSDRDVHILEVHSTCGCVVPSLPKNVYAPGESGTIEVRFDPAHRQGKEMKTINVRTNESGPTPYMIKVMAFVIPQVWIEPRVVYLGECRYDKITTSNIAKRVSITCGDPGFEITSSLVKDERVKLTVIGTEEVEEAGEKSKRFTFECAVVSEMPIGRIQAQLEIRTNKARYELLSIPIVFDAVGDLRLNQSPIFVRMSAPGLPTINEVALSSRTNTPFKLGSVKVENCDAMGMKVRFEPMPNNGVVSSYRIVLEGTTPQPGTNLAGKLICETDIADQRTFEVAITGAVPAASPQPATTGAGNGRH